MKELKVIGLMSGTSVDGIDACLVSITPDLTFNVIETLVFPYPRNIESLIFKAIDQKLGIKEICQLNFLIGEYFALAALEVIKKAGISPTEVDLIGSHGQTVYHYPTENYLNEMLLTSTLQLGEPSIIAHRTGITTIADFRPMDIAAGGQGAPLVCFADEVIFRKNGKIVEGAAIQNIGGMGNVTVVSVNCPTFAFDTGPGNVLIDYYTNKFFNLPYDKDGKIAAQGKVDRDWLDILLKDEYYKLPPPKTTGREKFSAQYADKMLEFAPNNPYDVVATTTALTAKTIVQAYEDFVFHKTSISKMILGGGGTYNPELINYLKVYSNNKFSIHDHEEFGISSKYKEALAFALLAYTSYYGIPNNVPACTGANSPVILGKMIKAF